MKNLKLFLAAIIAISFSAPFVSAQLTMSPPDETGTPIGSSESAVQTMTVTFTNADGTTTERTVAPGEAVATGPGQTALITTPSGATVTLPENAVTRIGFSSTGTPQFEFNLEGNDMKTLEYTNVLGSSIEFITPVGKHTTRSSATFSWGTKDGRKGFETTPGMVPAREELPQRGDRLVAINPVPVPEPEWPVTQFVSQEEYAQLRDDLDDFFTASEGTGNPFRFTTVVTSEGDEAASVLASPAGGA